MDYREIKKYFICYSVKNNLQQKIIHTERSGKTESKLHCITHERRNFEIRWPVGTFMRIFFYLNFTRHLKTFKILLKS